ncbi:hypothetical protein D9M69_258050 [compost metagenome]
MGAERPGTCDIMSGIARSRLIRAWNAPLRVVGVFLQQGARQAYAAASKQSLDWFTKTEARHLP